MKKYFLIGLLIAVLVVACQKIVIQIGDEGHETHEAGSIDFEPKREVHNNEGG